MTSAMSHNKTWSVISSRITKGSQENGIENEGEHWTGGTLQHPGLIIYQGGYGAHERQEEEKKQ